ncbi:hypothetical protein EDB89DRAFT_1971384 [Lactarius sanguifluus]|nr:hypothetical protein EDB89DRAFT_1971384 [Lactarius sanguifluus]
MHPLNAIYECLCLGHSSHYDVLEEQPSLSSPHEKEPYLQTTQSQAADILSILYDADTNDEHLFQQTALKAGAPMGQVMKDAYEKAAQVVGDVWEYAKEHPVLGFGELGPIEGTFAAWWQSTYNGYVPAKSLFSFFQRLGMIWRRKLPLP